MAAKSIVLPGYKNLLAQVARTIASGRSQAVWSLNSIMAAVYWDIGRQIVEFEQKGKRQAEYGERVMSFLAEDLHARFGRGFRKSNLYQFRRFYLTYRTTFQTASGKFKRRSRGRELAIFQTVSGKLGQPKNAAPAFILPWSHYVRLLSLKSDEARKFYETEAVRGGWSFRQLDRQISAQLYERLALSRDKSALLRKNQKPEIEDEISAESEIRDPYILEFLDLKDEYSESDLEDTLVRHLEQFLIELGRDFCFVGRQRRLRIGREWYRVDLLFFHRKLHCLVVIDLKVGKFTHADAGQMNLYLNYAREHWTEAGENPPVGLILCAEKDDAVAHYSLQGLPNKVLAREYRLILPDEKRLAAEIEKTRALLENRTRHS